MSTVNEHEISKIRSLYNKQNYSAKMIADTLGYSLNAIYYAMRKHKIVRRNPATNSKIQFENKPLSYRLKTPLFKDDEALKLAGVMLYWSEGYKTVKSSGVDFANSDVDMLSLFIFFLRNICGITEQRLRIYLYCHSNSEQNKLIAYWSKELSISTSQFTKPYIRKDSRVDKKDKMPYGLVHIRYYDKKLLKQILVWIEEYKKKLCVGGGVVNRIWL